MGQENSVKKTYSEERKERNIIIPSESLSRVTYTGIDGMQSQKIKRSYIRSTRKNRTRKKKIAVEEDSQKSPRKIKKNDPFE